MLGVVHWKGEGYYIQYMKSPSRQHIISMRFLCIILLLLGAACTTDTAVEEPAAKASNRAAPAWAKDVVWYQIFVERFRNGDPSPYALVGRLRAGVGDRAKRVRARAHGGRYQWRLRSVPAFLVLGVRRELGAAAY